MVIGKYFSDPNSAIPGELTVTVNVGTADFITYSYTEPNLTLTYIVPSNKVGSHSLTITVADPYASVSSTVAIEVSSRVPTATALPTTVIEVTETETGEIDIPDITSIFNDPDLDTLTY